MISLLYLNLEMFWKLCQFLHFLVESLFKKAPFWQLVLAVHAHIISCQWFLRIVNELATPETSLTLATCLFAKILKRGCELYASGNLAMGPSRAQVANQVIFDLHTNRRWNVIFAIHCALHYKNRMIHYLLSWSFYATTYHWGQCKKI